MFPVFALAVTTIAVPPSRPGWFLCDAVDAPVAVLVGAVRQGKSVITVVPRGTGAPVTRLYEIGLPDAGMSQIYYPVTLAGKAAGTLHFVQPAVLADPAAAWTPTFSSVTLGTRRLGCRWVAHTLFQGLDARRTILVTQEDGRIVYRSFDAARRGPVVAQAGFGKSNRATLTIVGGVRDRVGDATRFRFINKNHGYTVLAPDHGPARVVVTRGGRRIQSETLLAHTLGQP